MHEAVKWGVVNCLKVISQHVDVNTKDKDVCLLAMC